MIWLMSRSGRVMVKLMVNCQGYGHGHGHGQGYGHGHGHGHGRGLFHNQGHGHGHSHGLCQGQVCVKGKFVSRSSLCQGDGWVKVR